MGESERYIEYRDRQPRRRFILGQPGNPLMILFTLNAVLFLVLMISRLFYLATNQTGGAAIPQFSLQEWVAVPGNLNTLLHRPWTLLSFMFSHGGTPYVFGDILLVVSNMLWLWAFGYILQDITGNNKLIPVYIYGGLAGAVFFIIACNIFPSLKPVNSTLYLIGANSSLAAVAIAATIVQPSYRMFPNLGSGIPLWSLMLIYAAVGMLPLINSQYQQVFAFLGGIFAGFIFIYFLKKDIDLGKWMHSFYKWITHIFNPPQPAKGRQFYQTGGRSPYTKTSNVTQQKVDEILDKINQKGYHSLTEEEKQILKKASED